MCSLHVHVAPVGMYAWQPANQSMFVGDETHVPRAERTTTPRAEKGSYKE